MNTETDYIYIYLKNQLENTSNNHEIYSKRLLEYNLAKDVGYEALKELAAKWYSENENTEKQNNEIKNSSSYKFGVLIGIIGLIIFFIWLFFDFV
jgi:hypothetical protein